MICLFSDDVKSEPMELLCGTNTELDNSTDSVEANNDPSTTNNQLPQGPLSGSSGGDHDDHDSHGGPVREYLSSTESKLFASPAGSFNFSMAALAADPTGLGSKYFTY